MTVKFRFALGLSTFLLVMSLLLVVPARAETAAPEGNSPEDGPRAPLGDGFARAVILYDGLYSGDAQRWSLPESQPFRFVPDFGDRLRDKVSSLEVGEEVGVILFGGKFFQNEDRGCQPILGTREDPQLLWRGATSDLLPESQSSVSALRLEAPEDNFYRSMILFDREMGPPPGALLMQRLNSYSPGCETPSERLNYRRIFLSPWQEGQDGTVQSGVCRNVLGPVRYKDVRGVLHFNAVDHLFLLNPANADRAYPSKGHRVKVQLFDEVDCKGRSLELPRSGTSSTSFNLSDYGFGRIARSLRLVYLEGPAIAYASSVAPVQKSKEVLTVEAPVPRPRQQAVKIKPRPSVTFSQSAGTASQGGGQASVVANSEQQALEALFQAAGLSPAADKTLLPEMQSLEEEALKNRETGQREGANTAPLGAAESPPLGQQAPGARGEATTPAPMMPPPPRASLPSPGGTASATVVPPSQAEAGLSAPQSTVHNSDRYESPVVGDYRLDYCRTADKECGKPAAQAWCKAKGYSRAVEWSVDRSIGALFPTSRIGDGSVCTSHQCSGFEHILCSD